MRNTCNRSVHVAARIMCKDQMQVLCRIIYTLILPIRLEHSKNAHECRSPDNVRNWYVGAAKCRTLVILEEVCARLQHTSSLAYMGFTMDFGSGLPHGITLEHDIVTDEYDRSDRAMGSWLSCTLHRIGSMMWHFASWVGLFALAASDDDQDVYNCISRLRAHYRMFLNATSSQKKNKCLKHLVMS